MQLLLDVDGKKKTERSGVRREFVLWKLRETACLRGFGDVILLDGSEESA